MIFVLIERSFPMVAGMVSAFAEVEKPPAPAVFATMSPRKSNLKALLERREILPIAVGVCSS